MADSNPLLSFHERTDAEMQAYGPLQIVSTFGEPQVEYAAIHKGCAMIDAAQRGLLRAAGPDRLDFLNKFLTNQLIDRETNIPLAPGQGAYAFLLNNKGRIVADMNVLERGDHTLLETDARNIPALKSALEKFVFSEKVSFESQDSAMHCVGLHGPEATAILGQVCPQTKAIGPLGSYAAAVLGIEATIWRDDAAGVPGIWIAAASQKVPQIWSGLLERFGPKENAEQSARRELWPAGWAAFNAARIEAARPMFGIDFDDSVLPAETGLLDRAVSFTKGCYLGQEIVARMHARGQWSRQIVGFKMETDALPISGAAVYDGRPGASASDQVGAVTSSTISPILSNAAIGLAMVKRSQAEVGTPLLMAAEGALRRAAVVEMPFVRRGN